jgi:methyl-accepting chemotaxis protein
MKDLKEKRGMSLQKKLICFLLPIIIFFNFITFFLTMSQTKKLLKSDASELMLATSDSVSYKVSTDLQGTIGILENTRTSIENSCTTTEEVREYLFSVADAYLDRIPAGIYCGMTDGTYLDKCWEPDADWVMTERPWYQEGLVSDELTFGEMYMDANTQEYIISAYCNLKDKSGNVIGVLCADVQLGGVDEILRSTSLYNDGYVYAIDETTGIIMSNQKEEDKNGAVISELTDSLDTKVYEMMQNDKFGEIELFDGKYILLNTIENTNFVTVCIVDQKDVENDMKDMQLGAIATNVIGWIFISVTIIIILHILLAPIKSITDLMDRMYALDLTQRASNRSKDELGVMANKMNLFVDSLSDVIGKVKDTVSMVDDGADTNANNARELSDLAEKQNDSIEQLKEAMYEIAKAIEHIADGASELTTEIGSTSQAAITVSNMIGQTIKHVENGHTEMVNLTNTMSGISQYSEELQQSVINLKDSLDGINILVSAVNDIAGQTNLLSLNASIEAARAGESGRGFAVVAEEIRSLATHCAESVEDITAATSQMNQLMETVMQATEGTIASIQNGNAEVERSNAAFGEIEQNTQEMENAVESVKTAMGNLEGVATDMAASTEEQSASTTNVLEHCEQILVFSQQFNEEGQLMADASRHLRELSEQLGETVEQFTI